MPFDAWLDQARRVAHQPPAQPRVPLCVAGQVVGSVAEGFLSQIGLKSPSNHPVLLSIGEHQGAPAWLLDAPGHDVTAALNALADALRERGLCGPWRNEQLAVCNAAGQRLGAVERGAVRVLGIATVAVHLVGLAPDGRMWVQKRSMNKPNDPGLWDTLMGGMISASDSLEQALARETWEEAGLHVPQLVDVVHGGHVHFGRPSSEGGGTGYMVERIDWFRAEVPPGLEPANQDGEVECFELLPMDEVRQRMAAGLFTLEAALVIAAFLGC